MANYTVEDLFSLLPPIMKELDTSGDLSDFLEIFLDVLNDIREKTGAFANFYDVKQTPELLLPYLAEQMGVLFNYNFDNEQLRSAIQRAVSWYRIKGTKESLLRLLQSLGYTGNIVELFLDPSNLAYFFSDVSDLKPVGDMETDADWTGITTFALTTTTTVGEFKVGLAAVKFDKANSADYAGMSKDFGTGLILKDANVYRMRSEFWVYLPTMTNITGVSFRASNDLGGATNYKEWLTTTDYRGYPLAVGWNKVVFDLHLTPIDSAGAFTVNSTVKHVRLLVNTANAGDIPTGLIMDGFRFFSGGKQAPKVNIEFTAINGDPINNTIVQFLLEEFETNKPAYVQMGLFSFYINLLAYLSLTATLGPLGPLPGVSQVVNLLYAPLLTTDQDLPPVITLPDVITTDVGLLTDTVPYYGVITLQINNVMAINPWSPQTSEDLWTDQGIKTDYGQPAGGLEIIPDPFVV